MSSSEKPAWEINPGLTPSSFGVCCLSGRWDLKPDYRMSGFGPNVWSKLYFNIKNSNQCAWDALNQQIWLKIIYSESFYVFSTILLPKNFRKKYAKVNFDLNYS
jgi:hypothetical protein